MFTCTGYASISAEAPFTVQRRDPGPPDSDILYRGSDIEPIAIDRIETAYGRCRRAA